MSDHGEDQIIDEDGFNNNEDEEAELAAMRTRVAEMEKEAETLRRLNAGLDASSGGANNSNSTADGASTADGKDASSSATEEDPAIIDARSIYVGNVDYSATPEEIQSHFHSCGTINRITILCDRFTGPKGYAYVEFADPTSIQAAITLNESVFKGRPLSVVAKRTNIPGMTRGRGRGRGGYRGGYRGNAGYNPYHRGGRGFRGRGRGW